MERLETIALLACRTVTPTWSRNPLAPAHLRVYESHQTLRYGLAEVMTGKPIERLRVKTTHRPTPASPEPPGAAEGIQRESMTVVADQPVAVNESPIAPDRPLDNSPEQSSDQPLDQAIVPVASPSPETQVSAAQPTALADAETAAVVGEPLQATAEVQPTQPLHTVVATQLLRGVRFLGAPFVWLIVLAFCGGTGVSAILWLTTLPPLPQCDRLPLWASDSERLFCAEQANRSGKVEAMLAGIHLVKHWTADHPQFKHAQQLMKDWTRGVMQAAYQKVRQEDLPGAMLLAKKIPPNSQNYAEAQRALRDWQQDYQRGKAFEAAIQAALKQQNWKAAEIQLDDLAKRDGVYWGLLFNRLKQQWITEQLARRQVQQVRLMAASNPTDPETLGQLIAVLDRIAPTSYARSEAVAELTHLSQVLASTIDQRLAAKDLQGAIAAAQFLPETLLPPPAAQELLQFSQAQPLVTQQIPLQPTHQIAKLSWSLAYLQQIPPSSPLYAQTQALAQQLEQQLQDLTQIQFARSVANLNQPSAYRSAIALASAVAPQRPQRLYAQTMIADWRLALQRAEKRPFLLQARQFAAAQTVPALKAALTLATRIELGHPLRLEAQTAIADWRLQLQALEDQAIFKQAQQFAQQKKLEAAIKTASQIQPGRPRYAQVQTQIQAWTQQLQVAQDRPILNQAAALAQQGKLEAAIQYAAQIPPGRALYAETQATIAGWQTQLDAIAPPAAQPTQAAPPQENLELAPAEPQN